MSPLSFEKLPHLLAPLLVVQDANHSIRRTGVPLLGPALMLQCTICWLAGGFLIKSGHSPELVSLLNTLLVHPECHITFPQGSRRCEQISSGLPAQKHKHDNKWLCWSN